MQRTTERRPSPRAATASALGKGAALLAVLSATAAAQIIGAVSYADPATQGTITSASQTHTYLLQATPVTQCQQNDVLRITFRSQNSGYPGYTYYHRLDLWNGAVNLGTIPGNGGPLTILLPATAFYTITVRASDNQSTGWYAFKVDRLNDPVGADRIGFNWTVNGSRNGTGNMIGITATAEFAIYTLRAEAGSSALLQFSSQNSGYPSYWYYHYCELLDPSLQQVTSLIGSSAPSSVTFPVTGIYTLFVAARDYESTGWYSLSMNCQSWPACDGALPGSAHSSNYGQGWPGANNAVPALTLTAPPQLGGNVTLAVGNSFGIATNALVLWSLSGRWSLLPIFGSGATQLVASPSILWASVLPAAGTTLTYQIPNSPFLAGYSLALQSVVADPAVGPPSYGAALSRGLLLVVGQ